MKSVLEELEGVGHPRQPGAEKHEVAFGELLSHLLALEVDDHHLQDLSQQGGRQLLVVLQHRGKHVRRKVASPAQLTQLLGRNRPVRNPEMEVDNIHELVEEVG